MKVNNHSTCFLCDCVIPEKHTFCFQHSPAWGARVERNGTVIYMSRAPFLRVIVDFISGKEIKRYWVGTDVWLLHAVPPGRGTLSVLLHRLQALITNFFVSQHILNGPLLFSEFSRHRGLYSSADKTRLGYWVSRNIGVERRPHAGFNVLVYIPNRYSKFARYVYGVDLIEELEKKFWADYSDREIRIIHCNGGANMATLWQDIDVYIRPTRHDGWPRMVYEAKLSDIPTYYPFGEGRTPNVIEMHQFILAEWQKKQKEIV